MQWAAIHEQHAEHWLLVEALEAHSDDGRRVLDELSIVSTFDDSTDALRQYLELHRREPTRELYVAHGGSPTLEIGERRWVGVRSRGA